jgi:hypothetical protein
VSQDVFDCRTPRVWTAETTYYNKDDKIIYHHKYADPKYVEDMVKPADLSPRTVGYDARTIACNTTLRTPLVTKEELTKMKFNELTTSPNGEGEYYYQPINTEQKNDDKNAMLLIRLYADKKLADVYSPSDQPAFGDVKYRIVARLVSFDCKGSKFTYRKTEYYDNDAKLVDISAADPAKETVWTDIVQKTPLSLLQHITCGN